MHADTHKHKTHTPDKHAENMGTLEHGELRLLGVSQNLNERSERLDIGAADVVEDGAVLGVI